ncbi:MAG: NAD(P)H-quinone oxidoreductase [Rhodobacteraceae bacterium]|nr:NAD(P)H-quinone oxidoreductase [Paracoccaceae bacterium]
MRVVEIVMPGDPGVLQVAERDIPEPEDCQILIRNHAAGINRPDVLQRMGAYAPPPDASDLPGLESAGIVAGVGERVTRWQVGDPVCALLPGGGYAEYSLTHEDHALPIPGSCGFREAAALCETHFTVWSNVFMRGRLQAGETLLVHGGASGIGTTAIQLASAFGARVLVTAGSTRKCSACRDLGADAAINYREVDFVEEVRALTDGRGADVILDMVGGSYIPKNVSLLAEDGRLVQIAFLQGPKTELNFARVMMRRLTVTGSTLRPQSIQAKAVIANALRSEVWPLLETRRIAPVMDSHFPLDQAAAAHSRMESSAHIGKIVLDIEPDESL